MMKKRRVKSVLCLPIKPISNEKDADYIRDYFGNWIFVSADENLCKVAEYIGARVFNPLKK